jgi:hypothetical protein
MCHGDMDVWVSWVTQTNYSSWCKYHLCSCVKSIPQHWRDSPQEKLADENLTLQASKIKNLMLLGAPLYVTHRTASLQSWPQRPGLLAPT